MPARWRWSNPEPHGGNIFSMAYRLGVTVQVAERGQIYTSEDLAYWEPRVSGTTNSLRGVTFLGERLVITGERGTALYADSLEDFQLVNIGTSDWLEDVVASDNLLVAVGDNCAIYTSSDATAWTRENPPASSTNWLRGVAYGENTFVAVGEFGFIATANNSGKTWTKRTSGVTSHLNRIAYINEKFWAVGDNGVLLSSANGTSGWAPVNSLSLTNHLYMVAGSETNILVGGDKALRLSQNGGTTWTDELSGTKALPARSWTYLSSVWEDSLFLAAGRTGTIFEGFKTNSTDYLWVQRQESIRTWLWDVMRTPNFYVAVGDFATIMTSAKGVTWDLELVPDSATNSIFLGVGGTTNGVVAVGNKGTILFSPNTLTNVVLTNSLSETFTNVSSTVGTHWFSIPSPTTSDLQGVAFTNDLYVVTGGNGVILTSTDGTNWIQRTSGTSAFLSSVAAFPGGFVATGDAGTILSSQDGVTWNPQASNTTNWLYRVRYLNGLLVAVGQNGIIKTSADGTTWVTRASETTRWLNAVDFVGDTFFAVGNQGTVLLSADAITWSDAGTITQKSLFGLAAQNGQLLAVGIEGAIVRSQLTPILDAVKFVNVERTANHNLLLLSGVTDQKITLEHSTNLIDWVDGVTLEFLERSGTILYLEDSGTNVVPQAFFRARISE